MRLTINFNTAFTQTDPMVDAVAMGMTEGLVKNKKGICSSAQGQYIDKVIKERVFE